MKSSLLLPLAACISSAVAWTRTDHWRTKVVTTTSSKLFTSSIAVSTTGDNPPKPTSTATSVTTLTRHVIGGRTDQTYVITVTDLFYDPAKTSGLCRPSAFVPDRCNDTDTAPTTTATIATNYYHQIVISNLPSCTLTSYEYTTRTEVHPTDFTSLPDAARQATEEDQALLVTTWISTLSTNRGGQPVTTSICDVYLKEGVIGGISPGAEEAAMEECVDPRVDTCSWKAEASPGVECLTTGQTYPPTEASAGSPAVNTRPPTSGDDNDDAFIIPIGEKPSAADGLVVRMGMVIIAVVGGVVVLVL